MKSKCLIMAAMFNIPMFNYDGGNQLFASIGQKKFEITGDFAEETLCHLIKVKKKRKREIVQRENKKLPLFGNLG